MPQKKKERICTHCGTVLKREISRAKKDMPLFCTVDCALEFYQKQEPAKKKESKITTKVVNIRDIRITNPNWQTDSLFVYIGRNVMFQPMKKSLFHNPFSVKKYGRKKAIDKFERYFYKRINEDPKFKEAVEGLRGKILVCWCT